MATGVYAIRNKINTKIYIGSTATCLYGRWKTHRKSLRRGNHPNKHLQPAWDKYGEDSFEFIVVHECKPEDCVVLEQHYLDEYESYKRENGYNIRKIAESNKGLTGKKHDAETKERIAAAQRGEKNHAFGKKLSDEHRNKVSVALKGRSFTPEHKARLSERAKGRKHSEETKAKMSAAKIGEKNYLFGKKRSPEVIKKMSEGNKGKIRSIEARKNMSDSRKRYCEAQRIKNFKLFE